MDAISIETLQSITDSIAAGYSSLDGSFGSSAGESNTAALGAINNISRVLAIGDIDIINDLDDAAKNNFDTLIGISSRTRFYKSWCRAINNHIYHATKKSINNYLSSENCQLAPEFALIFTTEMIVTLNPENVFSSEIENMGSVTFSDSNTATFTDGDVINISLHSSQQLKVKLTTDFDSESTLTIFCKTSAGITEEKDVVITAGAKINDEFDVGTAANKYYDITNITVVGGEINNSCKVYAPRKRPTAL